MAYEYESKLRNYLIGHKNVNPKFDGFEILESLEEIKEVYRKAKAFDAIVNIEDDFVKYHGFYPCVEEYAEEVEEIISEQLGGQINGL